MLLRTVLLVIAAAALLGASLLTEPAMFAGVLVAVVVFGSVGVALVWIVLGRRDT